MKKADFIEKSKLILTNTFVKGGSTEDVFDEIYDKLVLPQTDVIKSVCEHDYFIADSINNIWQCRKCRQTGQKQTVL